MADFYLLKTEGGPEDGQVRRWPRELGWPLPDVLDYPPGGGHYIKTSESQLPASLDAEPHIARGAIYRWEQAAPKREAVSPDKGKGS